MSSLPPRDVPFLEALVHHGALLEEDHPRSDGGPDVRHEEKEHVVVEAAREVGDDAGMDDVGDGRPDKDGPGNVDKIEETEKEGDLFPGPVAPLQRP